MGSSSSSSVKPDFGSGPASTDAIFSGGGEMGALMRAFEWSKTTLGPSSTWPQSLKTAVRIILTSRYPMFVWWGRELINLYNDPYRAFLGTKHPAALGKSAREVWAEIWNEIGPRTDAVLLRGESTYDEALLLLMERHGYLEETYFTFSYSPVPDDRGEICGLFCAVTEETQKVIGKRRLGLLRDSAAAMAAARTPADACRTVAESLSTARRDVPFSLIYLANGDGSSLRCCSLSGIAADHPGAPANIDVTDDSIWPVKAVMDSGRPVVVDDLASRFTDLPHGEWDRPPDRAVLLPIARQGQSRPAGVLIAGLNPYRRFDEEFRGFLSLLADQIAAAIANAAAYEAERQRAEALAELDHAKTVFFSNVSHEFRTPLTLMLAPLEDVLGERALAEGTRNTLEMAHRNSLRLLKLVNALLDFSRIEAGRAEAVYEPTDLGGLTAEIASVFRSAMERGGLRFTVACEPIGEDVYVDRSMWEKIVLNLLSNAFKFTFEGEVGLELRRAGSHVQLVVRDTGVGIPQDQLPRIFERFHRIETTRARTYEGTGIGLALVQELVRLNGGTVEVQSIIGAGTTFTVTIPLGSAHLPAEQIRTSPRSKLLTGLAEIYLGEVEQWLPRRPVPSSAPGGEEHRQCILIADDNADMREYLVHLLAADYRVHAVSDGTAAVEAMRRLHPDLVLTDMMMPGLNGFEVVAAIRKEQSISKTPVILLSARAGEEARVEGLESGADDYLIKPFTARELLARIGSHLKLARARSEADARVRLVESRFRDLVETAAIAIHWVGSDGIILWANQAELDLLGYAREEYIGHHIGEFHADNEAISEILDRLCRGERLREYEARLRAKDGSIRHVKIDSSVLFEDGKFVHTRCFTRDVTERKEAETARARLAAIIESSDDAIVSKDLKGIVTSWNPAAERIFGYSAKEMIGRPILTIIPPELHSDEDRILSTIARGERIDHFETVRVTKSGERIDVSLTISPVKDAGGRIVGAAKIARDITQHKKAERALRTSERLASVGRLAATVAHEINNPLEAVTNYIYLARTAATRDDVRAFLAGAEEELQRVAHLTKQTLGFYRDTHTPTAMTVGSVVHALSAVFAPRSRNKGVSLELDIRHDPEIQAVGSELRQLVANLLSNSIDAVNEGGRIRVRVSAFKDYRQHGLPGVRLTVADSGSGIPAAVRPRLFEPFFTTKKDVGTGLGLWICKTIVQKHRGSIRFRSCTAPGRSGAVFSVFLPLDAQEPAIDQGLRAAV